MYREFLPCAALRRSVICYWTRAPAGGTHRVLPDGCMDILLRRPHESASFRAHIVGAMTTSLVIDHDASAESIGVRFAPGEAFRFLALPAREATDRLVALDATWGKAVAELESRISEARTVEARVSAVERALESRLLCATPADLRVRKAIEALGSDGATPRDLALGCRQLRRLFETHVGLSPKALSRVLRMRRAVSVVDRAGPYSWAGLATECGYFDQSHLAREFKALVGLSPTAFAKARAMTVSYNPPAPIRVTASA